MDHSEVAEYMVTSLDGTTHPALLARPGSGIVFDGKQKRWLLEADNPAKATNYDDLYLPCLEARNDLLATAKKYNKKLKQPALDIDTSCGWDEVEQSVQSACQKIDELAAKDKNFSGSCGKLKRAFRSLCRTAEAGENLLALIPNQTFTSVLCGGLKIIFSGLRETGAYREEVYKALEDLPYILTDHAAHVKIYDQDEQVHGRLALLYAAVFKLLNHILLWFLKSSFITGVKITVNPTGFKEKLRERMDQVRVAAQRFENHALKLSRQSQDKSVQLQCWTASHMSRMDENVQTIVNRTEALQEKLARAEVLEKLDPLLLDAWWGTFLKHQNEHLNRKPILDVAPQDVLSRFLYEPELISNDCAALKRQLQKSHRTPIDKNRLAALRSHIRLRAWLTVNEPSMLLLNGRADPRGGLEISQISAVLLENLLKQQEMQNKSKASEVAVIPLAFFCGLHRDWQRDPNGTPEEVAMSLMLQFIDRYQDTTNPTTLRQCYDRTRPGDLASICASLESLIMSLDSNVIVVLILDGLRHFTQPQERREKTRDLISRLVEIHRKLPQATLKFLFTSTTRLDFIEELFDESELFSLPRNPKSSLPNDEVKHKELVDFGCPVGSGDDELEGGL
ncbi:MAG: hypothetical protein M1821_001243 [Bathelium mastoideum]|nr:MAG: hypothetical protein M1821_001243 [Bathelium mastoideum]